jgi:hypothetical protein
MDPLAVPGVAREATADPTEPLAIVVRAGVPVQVNAR